MKVRVKEIGDDEALINPNDFGRMGVEPGNEVDLFSKDRGWSVALKPDESVGEGYIVLSKKNLERLRVREEADITIEPKREKGIGEEYEPPP